MADWITGILNSEFVENFIVIIVKVVMALVNLILFPIGALIETLVPDVNDGIGAIAQYFEYAGQYVGFIIDAMLIPTAALAVIGTFFTFVITIQFIVWGIKLASSWLKVLKP